MTTREPVWTAAQRAERLARCYDLDTLDVSYDAELYLQLAHQAGTDVLELAVGSGRLAVPLAMAGHTVVGVDDDPAMLERAWKRWSAERGTLDEDRLRLHVGDFGTFRSDQRSDLAFIAVNTFLLAPDDESRLAVLTTMRHHLRPGGLAAVECSTPDAETLAMYDGRLQLEWLRVDPHSGEEVTKSMSARHDPEAGTVEIIQLYEWTGAGGGPLSRVTQRDLLHLVEPAHLARLMHDVGFGEVSLWGDHLTIPYGAGSHRVIAVGRLL
jgi:SAM-dependent methyltransferase